jgi:hypothetical protein
MYIGYWWERQKERGPLGRRKRLSEDYFKENLRERRWGCMDWINLALDRHQWWGVVNTVMNLRIT